MPQITSCALGVLLLFLIIRKTAGEPILLDCDNFFYSECVDRDIILRSPGKDCTVTLRVDKSMVRCHLQLRMMKKLRLSILGALINSTIATITVLPSKAAITMQSTTVLNSSIISVNTEELEDVTLRGTWSNSTVTVSQRDNDDDNNKLTTVAIRGTAVPSNVTVQIAEAGLVIESLSMIRLVSLQRRSSTCYPMTIRGNVVNSTISSQMTSSLSFSSGSIEMVASSLSAVGSTSCGTSSTPFSLTSAVTLNFSAVVFKPFNLGSVTIAATLTESSVSVEQIRIDGSSGGAVEVASVSVRGTPGTQNSVTVAARNSLTIQYASFVDIVVYNRVVSSCTATTITGNVVNSTCNLSATGQLTIQSGVTFIGSTVSAVGRCASDVSLALTGVTLNDSTLQYTPVSLTTVSLGGNNGAVSMSSSTIIATQLSATALTTTCSILNIAGAPKTRNAIFVAPTTLSITSMRHVFLSASNAASCFPTTVTNNGVVASSTLLVACTAVSPTVASVTILSAAALAMSEIMLSAQRWSLVGQNFAPDNLTVVSLHSNVNFTLLQPIGKQYTPIAVGSVNLSSHPVLRAHAVDACVTLSLAGYVSMPNVEITGWSSVELSAKVLRSSLVVLLPSGLPACPFAGLIIADTANITQSNVSIQVPNRSRNILSGIIKSSSLTFGRGVRPSSDVTMSINGENITQSNISIHLQHRPTNRVVVDQLGGDTFLNVSGMCYRAVIRNTASTQSYVTLQSPLRVFNATSASTALSVLGPVGKDLDCPSETPTATEEDTRSRTFSESQAPTRTVQSVTMSLSSTRSSSHLQTATQTASTSPSRVRTSLSLSSSHGISGTNGITSTNTSTLTRSLHVSRTSGRLSPSASRRITTSHSLATSVSSSVTLTAAPAPTHSPVASRSRSEVVSASSSKNTSLSLSASSSSSHAISITNNTVTDYRTASLTTSFASASGTPSSPTLSTTLALAESRQNISKSKTRTRSSTSLSRTKSKSVVISTVTLTRTHSATPSRTSGSRTHSMRTATPSTTSSQTSSSSHTHSMRTATPTIPVVSPPAPSTVVEAAATTAAVATGASVVSALLGGSASADAGALAVVGMIACAPPSLRVAVGPMRFVLSPFVDFGGAAMVLGNVGVVAAFALLQAAATHALLVCTSWREDVTRFPHLSFLVCMLSLQGVVCGFLLSIADAPTAADGELALAVMAIVVAPLFVGAFLLTLYTCAMRCSSVGQYVFNDHETMSRQFLLPRGRWFPQALVRRFGFAFSSAHTTGNVRLCLAVVAHNVLFVVLSRVPIGSCVAQFALLAAVKVAVLLMLVICRPLRSHIDHLLDCANHLTLASLLLLLAVDASGMRLAAVSRDAALGSLSMLQGVFTLAKTAHMCFLNYYEVAINDDATPPQDDAKRRRGLSLRLLVLIDQAADEDRSDFSGSLEDCGSMELDDLFESMGFGGDEIDEVVDVAAKRPLEPPPWAMLFEEPPTEVPALVAANGVFWDEVGAAKSCSDLPAFSSFVGVSGASDCDGTAVSCASLLCTVRVAVVPTALESVAVAFPKAKRRRRRR